MIPDKSFNSKNYRLIDSLNKAIYDPEYNYRNNPETRLAFDEGLKELAKDIATYSPNLAHLLVNMKKGSKHLDEN